MASATFIPAPRPEGIVTIELSESEARDFIGAKVVMTCNDKAYSHARDNIRRAIREALRRG